MKNTVTLNIGLASNGKVNSLTATLLAVECAGLHVASVRTVTGEWEGVKETTLAIECVSALPLCHAECVAAVTVGIIRLAAKLGQECIAIKWPDGRGELLPRVAEFNPEYFHPAEVPATLPDKAIAEICNAACAVGNGAVKDNLLMTLASWGIAPKGFFVSSPEITSGW